MFQIKDRFILRSTIILGLIALCTAENSMAKYPTTSAPLSISKMDQLLQNWPSRAGQKLADLIAAGRRRSPIRNKNPDFKVMPNGGNSGGGGDAVLLESGKIVLLDFYEAVDRYKLNPVASAGNTLDEKVESLLRRMSLMDPVRAKLYRQWYVSFFAEAEILQNKKATDLHDEGGVFICERCTAFQLIVQKEIDPPVSPYRYYIVESLWDRMDLDQQSYTVIHELYLRELRMGKAVKVTEEIRYLNALLISNTMKDLSLQEYGLLLKKFGFAFRSNNQGYLYRLSQLDPSTALFADLKVELGPFIIPYFTYGSVGSSSIDDLPGEYRGILTACSSADCLTYIMDRNQLSVVAKQLSQSYPLFKNHENGTPKNEIQMIVVRHDKSDIKNWKQILIATTAYGKSYGSFDSLTDFANPSNIRIRDSKVLNCPLGYDWPKEEIFIPYYKIAYLLTKEDMSLKSVGCLQSGNFWSPVPESFLAGDTACTGTGYTLDLKSEGRLLQLSSDSNQSPVQILYSFNFTMSEIENATADTLIESPNRQLATKLKLTSRREVEKFEGFFKHQTYNIATKENKTTVIPFKVICHGDKEMIFSRYLQLHSCTLAEDTQIPYTYTTEKKERLFLSPAFTVETTYHLGLKDYKKGDVVEIGNLYDFESR